MWSVPSSFSTKVVKEEDVPVELLHKSDKELKREYLLVHPDKGGDAHRFDYLRAYMKCLENDKEFRKRAKEAKRRKPAWRRGRTRPPAGGGLSLWLSSVIREQPQLRHAPP